MDVHVPNEPPGDFRFMFPTPDGQKHRREHSRGDQVSRENTDPQALRVFRSHKVALYDGSVAYVDQQLERLLSSLEESGQLAQTLVVFTADHGEGLYDRIEDPGERQNLLAEDPARASTLAAQLHAILVAAENREREALEIDDATREQLRTLGK